MNTPHPIIQARQIVKDYPTPAGPMHALRSVNLVVGSGEFTAVIGKSGSGKSTLINILTGIDRPTSGEVRVAGTPLHTLSEEQLAIWRGRNLGVVFQFFQLLPTLTLHENVMLPMELARNGSRTQRKGRAMMLLEQVGMADHAHKLPAAVSGGQAQRVAIARALANDPPLVVADEPTGSLDSQNAETVIALFESLVAAGKTILMVTHDNSLALRASRAVLVADGRVLSEFVRVALPALDLDELLAASSQFEEVTYSPGDLVIRQGQPGAYFYVVTSGQAEVYLMAGQGARVPVGVVTPGQYLGEMALMSGGKTTADVYAGSAGMTALRLDRAGFEALLANSAPTREAINQVVAARKATLRAIHPQ